MQGMVLSNDDDTKTDAMTVSAFPGLLVMTETDLNKTLVIHNNRKIEESTRKEPLGRKGEGGWTS